MESTDLIAAFNAWHWVEPDKGVDLASQLLSSGGSLALVWTEVLSWGEDGFDVRLAEVTGHLGQRASTRCWLRCSPSAPMRASTTSPCATTGLSAGSTPTRSLRYPEPTVVTTALSATSSSANLLRTSSPER